MCGTEPWMVQGGEDESPWCPRLRCHRVHKQKSNLCSQNGRGNALSFSIRILSFVLLQPLKNCHSEQQLEIISVTVQQGAVTEPTRGRLTLVKQQSLTSDCQVVQ